MGPIPSLPLAPSSVTQPHGPRAPCGRPEKSARARGCRQDRPCPGSRLGSPPPRGRTPQKRRDHVRRRLGRPLPIRWQPHRSARPPPRHKRLCPRLPPPRLWAATRDRPLYRRLLQSRGPGPPSHNPLCGRCPLRRQGPLLVSRRRHKARRSLHPRLLCQLPFWHARPRRTFSGRRLPPNRHPRRRSSRPARWRARCAPRSRVRRSRRRRCARPRRRQRG